MKSETKSKETEIGKVPEDWDIREVKNLGKVITGKTPPTKEGKYFGKDYPFIKIPDMGKCVRVENSETMLSHEGAQYMFSLKLPPGSVMVSCLATIGKVGITAKESFTNQQINSVIPNIRKVIPEWIYYYFKNNPGYLESLGGGGSVYTNISKSRFESATITLPRLTEQRAITKILSDLDSRIKLNTQMNDTLEAIGQAIFKHWFADFEFPNEKGKPYKSSGGEMVDSELGEIPRGWKIGELTEFLDFLEGPGIRNWQYTLGGTRFINIRLIKNNDIDTANANYVSNEEAYGKYKHFLLEEKDMIVSTSGTLGRTAIVRKKHLPLMLNTSVIRFRPIDAESYPFMYQYLNSSLFYNELKSLASGSVQLNFGPMHLKSMKMLMPAKEILNLYNKSVSCVYDKIVSNLDKSDILSHLRDSLLPHLMSGKIRIDLLKAAAK